MLIDKFAVSCYCAPSLRTWCTPAYKPVINSEYKDLSFVNWTSLFRQNTRRQLTKIVKWGEMRKWNRDRNEEKWGLHRLTTVLIFFYYFQDAKTMMSKDSVQRFRCLYFIHTDQRLLSTLLCGKVYNLNRIEYIKNNNIKMVWFPSAKIWIDSYTCMCIQSGQFYSLILVWGLDDSSFIFLR